MVKTYFSGQRHAPVNPNSHEGAHEGPRGYAHALKDGATFIFEQPALPEDLDEVEIHDLAVRGKLRWR